MSLAPRPASPGTNVPSRNRSAPLELWWPVYPHQRPAPPTIPGSRGRVAHPRGRRRCPSSTARSHSSPSSSRSSASSWWRRGRGCSGSPMPSSTFASRGRAAAAAAGRVRAADLVEEVGEHHRGVEARPARAARRARGTRRTPGRRRARPPAAAAGGGAAASADRGRAGVRASGRVRSRRAARPACRRRRASPHASSSSGSPDVEAAHLHVHLHDLDARVATARRVPPRPAPGRSVAAHQRLGHPRREPGRPVVEQLGHRRAGGRRAAR